jgi:hypothetical protein
MTPRISRRDWLRLNAAGVLGASLSGWLPALAADTVKNPQRKRSCILLWMNGGPSQMDTFDLKPGHANGGPFKEIETNVPGVRISEHLPKLAKHADKLAIIRSMSTREGDHDRASYQMRTGYLPQGSIQFPPLGALLSKELGGEGSELPNFVSIAPLKFSAPATYGPGFLGPQYAPLVVGDATTSYQQGNEYDKILTVQDLRPNKEITSEEIDARVNLLTDVERDFLSRRDGASARSHRAAYERAVRLMRTAASKAFELDQEKPATRDAYGKTLFGQSCLLARRLVERGVPFVEVTLGNSQTVPTGWDTHNQNFTAVQQLSQMLDPAWATLLSDLKERGLLETTMVVWMGEFGRTPKINGDKGRDHYPNAWTTVLGGGGIKGGQAYGRTSKDGTTVEDRPTNVTNFLATVCRGLGVDSTKQNDSNVGRPIRIVDKAAEPIKEVLA